MSDSAFNLSQLSNEVSQIGNRQLDKYIGNLKREKKCPALRQHHFLVADCDDKGNLIKKDLLVQFVGVKVEV